MSEGQEFTFKPAPLKRPVTYSLRRGMLMGPLGMRVRLADVTRLQLVQHKQHGRLVRRLDVIRGRNRDRIQVTGEQATAKTDEDVTTHLALVESVVDHLLARDPEMPVTLSETGWSRWIMSAAGVFCVLVGLGTVGLLLSRPGGIDGLFTYGPMVAAMIAFGAVVTWKHRPTKDPHIVPLRTLPPVLAYLAGTLTVEDASAALGIKRGPEPAPETAPAPEEPKEEAKPKRRLAKSGHSLH
ncbi:hypothetical protein [Pseudooceanicola nanhaiensis]|uniref:hypothetical protein n=1 Tax=Pseudooceanicola nanhaiensis TaxID=375761 RepID=UPI001CD50D20|nr:hypothetical protein [Pseudooceanicola nanhaiensis]MCA0922069.1 hypothetical protein [Pseudooceanicola nanhaiensis]